MKTENAKGAIKGAAKKASQSLRGRTGIYSTLAKEHGEVSALMSKCARTSNDDPATRGELFAKIETELKAHSQAEDEIFYQALSSRPETHDKIQHSRTEHQEVETLLDELGAMDLQHQSWMNKFERLKEAVEHHVHEEEGELFPRAEDVLSGDEAKALDDRYKQRKQQLIRH